MTRHAAGDGATVSVALARVAQELLAAGATASRRSDSRPAETVQIGRCGGTALVTAAPVLTYAGAPAEYPEIGGAWGAEPPVW